MQTESKSEKVRKMLKAGDGTAQEIARAAGVSERLVRYQRKALGLPRFKAGARPSPESMTASLRIAEMRGNGVSLAEIGRRFGMTKQGAFGRIKKLNKQASQLQL